MLAADPDARADEPDRPQARATAGVLPFEVSSVGIRRDGVFAGIQGAARDITERERLERELRESRGALPVPRRELAGHRLLDRRRGRLHVRVRDDRADRPGSAPGELVGGHFSQVVDPRVAADARSSAGAARRRADRTPGRASSILAGSDGGDVPVEVSSIGHDASTACSPGIHGATRDITRARAPRARPPPPGRRARLEPGAGPPRPRAPRLGDPGAVLMTLVTRTHELLVDRDPAAAKAKLGVAARPPARGPRRDAGADLRAPARQPRARRPAAGAADPRRRAPGPDRPADRRRRAS